MPINVLIGMNANAFGPASKSQATLNASWTTS
jgi:hypothetical protein